MNKYHPVIAPVLTLCLLVAAPRSDAVDPDLYSLEDYLNLGQLGGSDDEDGGNRLTETLVITNLKLGRAANYQEDGFFPGGTLNYGQIDLDYYLGRFQVGLSLRSLDFSSQTESREDPQSILFHVDRYFSVPDEFRIFVSLENSDVASDDLVEGKIGMNLDINLGAGGVFGGMYLEYRSIPASADESSFIVHALNHFDDLPFEILYSYGVTWQKNDIDFADTNIIIEFSQEVPSTPAELRYYYSISYHPERFGTDNETNNEIGLYLNLPLVFL